MEKLIRIRLSGHEEMLEMDEDAYNELQRYLLRVKSRVEGLPRSEDVIRELEQSIGEKLKNRLDLAERAITIADVNAVLAEFNEKADTGKKDSQATVERPRIRRLYRIKKGQQIAGVCEGLSAYSDVGVEWVRTIFVLLTLFTAGSFIFVYILLMFILPTVPTREDINKG